MIPDEIYLKILRSAVKSPSGHNTQPWLFSKSFDDIYIQPDFSRALHIADPEHRELFVSMGCAAETAMIAARFYGYNPVVHINSLNGNFGVRISLRKDPNIKLPELFSYIAARQTTRNMYEETSIPEHELEKLKTAVSEAGIKVRFLVGKEEIHALAPFIAEASAIQMSNSKYKRELIHWMRFSESELMQKGDGLFTACCGAPSMGRLLGSFVLKNLVSAKSENRRLLNLLETTASVALFTTLHNDREHWIKTGMAFQRFALTATKLNISHSHLNSPCQVAQIRDKMISALGLTGEFPQLIIRMGYSNSMPYTLHRNIYHFLSL